MNKSKERITGKSVLVLIIIILVLLAGCANKTGVTIDEDGKPKTASIDEFNSLLDLDATFFAFDGRYYYMNYNGDAIYRIQDPKTGKLESIYTASEYIDGLLYSNDYLFFFEHMDDTRNLCSLKLNSDSKTVLGEYDHDLPLTPVFTGATQLFTI